MNDNTKEIVRLADGELSSEEIAEIVGLSSRYVRKVIKRLGLPALHRGAQPGENNHQFVSGRRVDLDGYVLVTPPTDHPFARKRPGRHARTMFEHRLVLEKKLGRFLRPGEVVDHIDGLTLHNDPSNLRLFEQNGDHLRETITGLCHKVSGSGLKNIQERYHLPKDFQPVDTHYRRRERGDVRLRQMILAALKLGIDSPFLLGTHRHFEKAGIDPSYRSNLELALDGLSMRWEADLLL